MRTAIRKHRWDFIALIGLFAVAMAVATFILGHQRFYLPKWVPLVGSNFVSYKAEFTTAQSVTPGQGQTVNVAGVPVGEIAKVQLKDGRALVTIKIKHKYAHVYKDATALLRPKTGLNDMIIELTPGTKRAGVLDHSTADLAWTLMLGAARRITEVERKVRGGEWTGWRLKQWPWLPLSEP